ncbi:MAG: hypothetical protein LBR61_02075 [Synergistaceae bacterium]|jgi:hypothetical protein|nr:hypothetical protein [Synergistaceae bacterium]
MAIEAIREYISAERFAAYGAAENFRPHAVVPEEVREEALDKVEEAQTANTQTTFQMMDRHTEMVKKSQELAEARNRKLAIERQNQKHREEQSALMAEIALQNAERQDLFENLRQRANA